LAPATPLRRPSPYETKYRRRWDREQTVHTSPEHKTPAGIAGGAVGWLRSRRRNTVHGRHCWPALRCVVLRTSATRNFLGAASVVPWDLAIVDLGRHLPLRQGTAPWVFGLTGHDQTPKQPEGAMVEVGTSIDAVPRDRRRRRVHGGFILQSARTTAVVTRTRTTTVVTRKACRSPRAASLRWPSDRASLHFGARRFVVTASAGDAATGSRRRTSSGLIPASGAGQVTRSASCPSRPHGRCCQVE